MSGESVQEEETASGKAPGKTVPGGGQCGGGKGAKRRSLGEEARQDHIWQSFRCHCKDISFYSE